MPYTTIHVVLLSLAVLPTLLTGCSKADKQQQSAASAQAKPSVASSAEPLALPGFPLAGFHLPPGSVVKKTRSESADLYAVWFDCPADWSTVLSTVEGQLSDLGWELDKEATKVDPNRRMMSSMISPDGTPSVSVWNTLPEKIKTAEAEASPKASKAKAKERAEPGQYILMYVPHAPKPK